VAVVGVPDELLGEVIKAVVVKRNGHDIAQREIQAHCRKNLAIYKVPKFVEFAEDLPKTASGKLRRYLLVNQN
jgi:long-chain acyl-CoA synthetase